MFSGIVEEIGIVRKVEGHSGLLSLSIQGKSCLEGLKNGDSISVNGVCLTVCNKTSEVFACQAIPETLARTNLGNLKVGSLVNLEKSITPLTSIGGHFVQGHVDGTTCIKSLEPEGQSLKIWFHKPTFYRDCFIPKGYIALDGMSLTLVDCTTDAFSICFIPYTQSHTIVEQYQIGTIVNLEIDHITKTISQMINERIPHVA